MKANSQEALDKWLGNPGTPRMTLRLSVQVTISRPASRWINPIAKPGRIPASSIPATSPASRAVQIQCCCHLAGNIPNPAGNGRTAARNGFASARNGRAFARNGFVSARNGRASAGNGFVSAGNGFASAGNGFISARSGRASAGNGFAFARNGCEAVPSGYIVAQQHFKQFNPIFAVGNAQRGFEQTKQMQ